MDLDAVLAKEQAAQAAALKEFTHTNNPENHPEAWAIVRGADGVDEYAYSRNEEAGWAQLFVFRGVWEVAFDWRRSEYLGALVPYHAKVARLSVDPDNAADETDYELAMAVERDYLPVPWDDALWCTFRPLDAMAGWFADKYAAYDDSLDVEDPANAVVTD